MAAGTSEAWDRLMAAPWGNMSAEAKRKKAEALATYEADWQRHTLNPSNQEETRDVVVKED